MAWEPSGLFSGVETWDPSGAEVMRLACISRRPLCVMYQGRSPPMYSSCMIRRRRDADVQQFGHFSERFELFVSHHGGFSEPYVEHAVLLCIISEKKRSVIVDEIGVSKFIGRTVSIDETGFDDTSLPLMGYSSKGCRLETTEADIRGSRRKIGRAHV